MSEATKNKSSKKQPTPLKEVQRTSAKEWDTPAWREERNRRLMDWFANNKDAVVCMVLISNIVEIWDDLIDARESVSDTQINTAFLQTLIDLPSNPFWKQYQPLLNPIIMVSVNAWMDANDAQKSDEQWKRRMAFYLRNASMELVLYIAQLTGGWQHLRNVSMEIREFFAHEDYEQWEHCNEKHKPD